MPTRYRPRTIMTAEIQPWEAIGVGWPPFMEASKRSGFGESFCQKANREKK
jgi:hypothetical protein